MTRPNDRNSKNYIGSESMHNILHITMPVISESNMARQNDTFPWGPQLVVYTKIKHICLMDTFPWEHIYETESKMAAASKKNP